MTAFTLRTHLSVNAGGVDTRYTRATDRAYWTVRYPGDDGVMHEFEHHGPTSVKQALEAMGIPFGPEIDVTFHKPK